MRSKTNFEKEQLQAAHCAHADLVGVIQALVEQNGDWRAIDVHAIQLTLVELEDAFGLDVHTFKEGNA